MAANCRPFSDCYTDLLLRRLNPSSPSFLDWGKKQPYTILDIGCGRGNWCLWAASFWKNAQVTGFDLVDITLPAFSATDNLTFVRGNL
jgi:2-polyprenyl-3-methyl-5-hydroxy-6-metoxy-1,4-benzoquinol methylase